MFKYVSFLVFLASVLTAPWLPIALADNGESELASVEDLSVQPEVFLVSNQRKKDCTRVGTVCLFANGGGTVAGVDVNPTVGIVTTLARGTQFATLSKTDRVPDADTWYVEMIARFRARTSAAPIVVAVMDYSDPEGMDRKEAIAVWQIEGSQTKDLRNASRILGRGWFPSSTHLPGSHGSGCWRG